jgi:hypothetical protein
MMMDSTFYFLADVRNSRRMMRADSLATFVFYDLKENGWAMFRTYDGAPIKGRSYRAYQRVAREGYAQITVKGLTALDDERANREAMRTLDAMADGGYRRAGIPDE